MTLLLLSPSPFLMEQVEVEIATRMPSLRVVGKCYTLREGIRAAQALLPDVTLLDGNMKGVNTGIVASLIKSSGLVVLITAKENMAALFNKEDVALLERHFEVVAFIELLNKN